MMAKIVSGSWSQSGLWHPSPAAKARLDALRKPNDYTGILFPRLFGCGVPQKLM
jgi:hypothetical protein